MTKKPLSVRLLYLARDLRSGPLFRALDAHCRGDVLDVGGWDFFETARRRGVDCTTWTTLEPTDERTLAIDDPRFRLEIGDGQAMHFPAAAFDTVLNVQVLEHVFEPLRMVQEIGRVLRPGGHAIFLIPQTSTTHLAPHYHCNFSRYWIAEAMPRAGLEIVEQRALGGRWSSTASHMVYFFLQAFRFDGMSGPEYKRTAFFYVLLPFMMLWALVSIPVCLVFSLGDLTEEPNNHLVVCHKRENAREGAAVTPLPPR